MLLRRLIRSFSFRILFISMLVFFMAMFAVRVGLYRSTVERATVEVRTIIDEQFYQIDHAFTTRSMARALNLMAAILHFDIENNFALAFMDARGLMREGNLTAWPEAESVEGEWVRFKVALLPENSALSEEDNRILGGLASAFKSSDVGIRTFLARVHTYPNGSKLLVGYDMRHAEQVRSMLFNMLVEGFIISLLAAILCSAMIAYWINRRLRLVNRTCASVIAGNLDERAASSGGSDEFDQLSGNFNAMLEWINRLIHSIKDTTNALAHDMRTPLSRHRLQLSQLLEQPDLATKHRAAQQASVEEIDRIVELYDNILNISRAESRAAVEQFSEFNLHALLTDVIELYEPFAEQKQTTLSLDCSTELYLRGEQQMVAQAVVNLVDNAVKYAPTGSIVAVRAARSANTLTITIADNGAGIPPEDFEKVKERFYRLDKSRTTPGTGLGLSLVDAVMRLHSGKFILSDNCPGLTVSLEFPTKY